MVWFRGRWVKWAVVGVGLLTTSCAGVVGAGAAVVVVGAGIVSMTCYDRVSVTVTDQLTGTKLCDAKVTFTEGKNSVTEATSCYQAALSSGHYKLRVERKGLVPFEEPVDIDTGKGCKHAVQTIYVGLDRLNRPAAPQHIGVAPGAPDPQAPINGTVLTPAPATAPPPTAPPASAAPLPAAPPPPPAAAPPASTAFPDTP